MSVTQESVKKVLETIPGRYRGPGGAIAVVKDGEVLGQHAWGYADIDQRIPMTAQTMIPICSISKQFFCALLVDLERHPTPKMAMKGTFKQQVSDLLGEFLPEEVLKDTGLTFDHLCNMSSGLRDYWALTILWGAKPEARFGIAEHSRLMLDRIKSFHFKPGDEFSYCNTNFHVIGRLIERLAGEPLEDLLSERIFGPARMATAKLCPDTARAPPPCVGYEGDEEHGFVPALNAIEWSGDAGIVATLEDMIAYERFVDRSFNDSQGLFRIISEQHKYNNGVESKYHYGLGHFEVNGIHAMGHGGALRGYRLHRNYMPSARLSTIVMLNCETAGARGIAEQIVREILHLPMPSISNDVEPVKEWFGNFLDKDAQLLLTVKPGRREEIVISYVGSPETIKLTDPTHAESPDIQASIEGDVLCVSRLKDNRILTATRVIAHQSSPLDTDELHVQGTYRCDEIDSVLSISGQQGMLYGAFDGFLGTGPMHLMKYVGENIWLLSCPRSMDAPSPGDWTIIFSRDKDGLAVGATVGCWLARKLEYKKI